MRRLIDEKFRGFSAYRGGSVAIWVLVEVVVAFYWEFDRNARGGIGSPPITTTARECYQTTLLGIFERWECTWYSHSGAVVHDTALRQWKISLFFRESFQSSDKKRNNGHRLVTVKYFSHCELLSLPTYYIRPPMDEKFRGFLSNLDARIIRQI